MEILYSVLWIAIEQKLLIVWRRYCRGTACNSVKVNWKFDQGNDYEELNKMFRKTAKTTLHDGQ